MEELKQASPEKKSGLDEEMIEDSEHTDLSDAALKIGLDELQASYLYHPKLDSHLQKSLKDPINLVQGVSPTMQQIFANCSFLFPFSTKQLYFRLVSFISSIDV